MPTSRHPLVRAALVCLLTAAIGRAEEVHYDVFATGSGGSLVIGGYDDTSNKAKVPADQMRVFGGEVVPTGSAPAAYESEAPGEPGFRASPQSFLNDAELMTPSGVFTALPGGTPLAFSFLPISIDGTSRNLFFWNGTGAVAFAPAAADVTLGLIKKGGGGWTAGITGASAGTIAGNTIQTTLTGTRAGYVHTHLYTSIAKAGSVPDQGFYLYSLSLQMTGLTDSVPLYFVFGALDPEDLQFPFDDLEQFEKAHEDAEAWVAANVVPEPAGFAGMAAVVALPLLRFLRRRSG
ncbi:MAG: hypothetical protein FJ286_03555 [Planctomycetes bacterium]|nr:hypothetical protein [Planctomycetota bacterium]